MLKVETNYEKRAFGPAIKSWRPFSPAVSFCPLHCTCVARTRRVVLTSRLLEAVAPLVVRELAILEGVAGVEERLDTGLIFIQVDGVDLCVVQQKVIVHVQLVEHPAQGVLADGQDAGVKPCQGKGTSQLPPRPVLPTTTAASEATSLQGPGLRGALPEYAVGF